MNGLKARGFVPSLEVMGWLSNSLLVERFGIVRRGIHEEGIQG